MPTENTDNYLLPTYTNQLNNTNHLYNLSIKSILRKFRSVCNQIELKTKHLQIEKFNVPTEKGTGKSLCTTQPYQKLRPKRLVSLAKLNLQQTPKHQTPSAVTQKYLPTDSFNTYLPTMRPRSKSPEKTPRRTTKDNPKSLSLARTKSAGPASADGRKKSPGKSYKAAATLSEGIKHSLKHPPSGPIQTKLPFQSKPTRSSTPLRPKRCSPSPSKKAPTVSEETLLPTDTDAFPALPTASSNESTSSSEPSTSRHRSSTLQRVTHGGRGGRGIHSGGRGRGKGRGGHVSNVIQQYNSLKTSKSIKGAPKSPSSDSSGDDDSAANLQNKSFTFDDASSHSQSSASSEEVLTIGTSNSNDSVSTNSSSSASSNSSHDTSLDDYTDPGDTDMKDAEDPNIQDDPSDEEPYADTIPEQMDIVNSFEEKMIESDIQMKMIDRNLPPPGSKGQKLTATETTAEYQSRTNKHNTPDKDDNAEAPPDARDDHEVISNNECSEDFLPKRTKKYPMRNGVPLTTTAYVEDASDTEYDEMDMDEIKRMQEEEGKSSTHCGDTDDPTEIPNEENDNDESENDSNSTNDDESTLDKSAEDDKYEEGSPTISDKQRKREKENLPARRGVQFNTKVDTTGVANSDKRPYTSRRLRFMISIATPQSKPDMFTKINEQIIALVNLIHRAFDRLDESDEKPKNGKKKSKSFYLREYQDRSKPSYFNKGTRNWINNIKKTSSVDVINTYFQGSPKNTTTLVRKGSFYFRINAAFPTRYNIESILGEINCLIENTDTQQLSDILSQNVTDPVKIGALVRSHGKMTQSDDLQNEIQAYMPKNVFIGLQFGNVPKPYGKSSKQPYDKKNSIRAVIIETNQSTVNVATKYMLKLFPPKKTAFGKIRYVNMFFIYSVHHPLIKNHPHAIENIMTLMNRHKRCLNYMTHLECTRLNPTCLNMLVYEDESLLGYLMQVKVKVTTKYKKGNLFHSIDRSYYRGKHALFFTFHTGVKAEATAVVGGIIEFLRDECGIDPSPFCPEYEIDDDSKWDSTTRTISNEATRVCEAWLTLTSDLQGKSYDTDDEDAVRIAGNDEQSLALNSMDKREADRMMGLNDTETIVNVKEKKKTSHQPLPSRKKSQQLVGTIAFDPTQTQDDASAIGDNESVGLQSAGGTSTGSAKSSFSKTERAKADLREEFEEELEKRDKLLEATNSQLAQLTALLSQHPDLLKTISNPSNPTPTSTNPDSGTVNPGERNV